MGGRRKSLSTQLSRKDPQGDDFDEAVREFHNGSDRVAAIMGAALVENNLNKVIDSWLDDHTATGALFYDEGAPFGTFKRKIVAGRAMGLFDDKLAGDMDIIRDVRNQFAHALLSIDFDNELIKDRCDALNVYKFELAAREPEVSETRLKYERACWGVAVHLLHRANLNLAQKTLALRNQTKVAPPTLADLVSRGLEDSLNIGNSKTGQGTADD